MKDINPHYAMSWRQRDILQILHGPKSTEKELLCKFRPFNQHFLDEAGIELPVETPVCDTSSEISLSKKPHIPFKFEEHRKLGKEAIDRVPFFAWIQLSLEIPSVHIATLKREMEDLSDLVFFTNDSLDQIFHYKLEMETVCYLKYASS